MISDLQFEFQRFNDKCKVLSFVNKDIIALSSCWGLSNKHGIKVDETNSLSKLSTSVEL